MAQAEIWTWKLFDGLGPKQINGHDCGVFVCMTANYIALGVSPKYGQEDMKTLREIMRDHCMGREMLDDGSDFDLGSRRMSDE